MIDSDYTGHRVFNELKEYADFYATLSDSVMSSVTYGIQGVMNIDTYAFTSIKGTIESIHDILIKGRINDAYALLRKYHDSIMINTYASVYLADKFSVENFVVAEIDGWLKGTKQLPEYRIMSHYVRASGKLKPINGLLYTNDNRYKKIRDRCNDHTHYNFYHNLILNDNEVHLDHRVKTLDLFSNDVENLFILHFAYVFFLNDYYMSSSDYVDYLDAGMTPVEGSQYYVASFVQAMFDKVKAKRPDIAYMIKDSTMMQLE